MAESILTSIQRRLKAGYTIVRIDGQIRAVRDPTGSLVWDTQGYLITFRESTVPTGHLFENIIAALRRADAIQPRRKAEHRPREARRVDPKEPKNSVIIATETLRDAKATPRERALARNYLALLESQRKLKELARALGRRLKEIEDLQD